MFYYRIFYNYLFCLEISRFSHLFIFSPFGIHLISGYSPLFMYIVHRRFYPRNYVFYRNDRSFTGRAGCGMAIEVKASIRNHRVDLRCGSISNAPRSSSKGLSAVYSWWLPTSILKRNSRLLTWMLSWPIGSRGRRPKLQAF